MTPGEGPVNLDIDMDGSPDLKVYVDHPHQPGGYRSRFFISCVNSDAELSGNQETDTLFINSVYINAIPNQFPNNYVTYNQVYRRVSNKDSIAKIESSFKLKFSDNWQKSDGSLDFKNGTFLLKDQPYFIGSAGSVVINDTLRYIGVVYNENYNPLPDNQTKYIALRIKSKEGYVKLSVSTDYKFNVLETGILKH